MSESKETIKDQIADDFQKKLREVFGRNLPEEIVPEEKEPQPPLEEAIERALFSLNEIAIFAEYGRSAEASREAKEAYEVVKALHDKFIEQNKIVDILSGHLPNEEECD